MLWSPKSGVEFSAQISVFESQESNLGMIIDFSGVRPQILNIGIFFPTSRRRVCFIFSVTRRKTKIQHFDLPKFILNDFDHKLIKTY